MCLDDRRIEKGKLLGVLLVGPFMAQADATIANVATPSIHADLGASVALQGAGAALMFPQTLTGIPLT